MRIPHLSLRFVMRIPCSLTAAAFPPISQRKIRCGYCRPGNAGRASETDIDRASGAAPRRIVRLRPHAVQLPYSASILHLTLERFHIVDADGTAVGAYGFSMYATAMRPGSAVASISASATAGRGRSNRPQGRPVSFGHAPGQHARQCRLGRQVQTIQRTDGDGTPRFHQAPQRSSTYQ